MEVTIKSRWGAAILFTAVLADSTPSHLQTRDALVAARRQGADLQGADLQGADLQGADLQGADLQGADLQGADLQGADLRGAYLQGADLRGADLQGADLQGADLQGADLRGAYLQGADLRGAYLQGADLRGTKEAPELVLVKHVGRASRSDGYEFNAFELEGGGLVIRAGCRTFTAKEFKAHVASDYPGGAKAKAKETLRIIKFLEAQAKEPFYVRF